MEINLAQHRPSVGNLPDKSVFVRIAIEIDLVARQAQVGMGALAHVVVGRLTKQIVADLDTVEKTIKVHRARIMEKMAVGSLAELVRVAERLGLPPAAGTANTIS
jgi:FixJ family two-component response regulator